MQNQNRVSTQTQFLSKFPTSNFQVLSLESFFGTPRRPLLKLGSSKLKANFEFPSFCSDLQNLGTSKLGHFRGHFTSFTLIFVCPQKTNSHKQLKSKNFCVDTKKYKFLSYEVPTLKMRKKSEKVQKYTRKSEVKTSKKTLCGHPIR